MTRADFPLPTLAPVLESIRQSVLFGRGFQLIRGFPVDRLSRQEVILAYWGVSLYWCAVGCLGGVPVAVRLQAASIHGTCIAAIRASTGAHCATVAAIAQRSSSLPLPYRGHAALRQNAKGHVVRLCCALRAPMPQCPVAALNRRMTGMRLVTARTFLSPHQNWKTAQPMCAPLPLQVGHVKNLTGSNETFGVRVYLTSAAQVGLG